MAFVSQEDILTLFEEMICQVFKAVVGHEFPRPFPRMEYSEAMRDYGIDKPDLRCESGGGARVRPRVRGPRVRTRVRTRVRPRTRVMTRVRTRVGPGARPRVRSRARPSAMPRVRPRVRPRVPACSRRTPPLPEAPHFPLRATPHRPHPAPPPPLLAPPSCPTPRQIRHEAAGPDGPGAEPGLDGGLPHVQGRRAGYRHRRAHPGHLGHQEGQGAREAGQDRGRGVGHDLGQVRGPGRR